MCDWRTAIEHADTSCPDEPFKTLANRLRALGWTDACSSGAQRPALQRVISVLQGRFRKESMRQHHVNPTTNTGVMNIALGVLVLLTSFVAGTEPRDGSHVRTMDKRLRSAIDEGLARSALFRSLVARLDGSDVIVYVEHECPMSSRMFGRLTLLGTGGERRYVNVRISCMLTIPQQIAAIGHELRHAVEIADAPAVTNDASLAAEYRKVGFRSRALPAGDGFESRAAIEAARQVWLELARTAE